MQANQKIQILLLSALLTAGTIQANETVSTLLTHGTNLINWSIQKGADAFNFVWPKAQKYGQELAHQASQLATTGKQNVPKWTIAELHKSVDSPLLSETGNQFVDGVIPSLPGAWSQEKLVTHASNLPKKIGSITQAFAPHQTSFDRSGLTQTVNTDYCPAAIKYALIASGLIGTAYVVYRNKDAIAAKWAQLRESPSEPEEPESDEEIISEE